MNALQGAEAFDLTGKGAIVTGAASGLGRAVCLLLSELGGTVVAADLNESGLEETKELAKTPESVITFTGDVSLEPVVQELVAKARSTLPAVDFFHNNVGVGSQFRPLEEMDYGEFQRVFRINVDSIFLGMRYVLPLMYENGKGSIVNTASMAAFLSPPKRADYVSSKHAVMGLTRTAAIEGAARNVRVNAICPGPINTPMMQRSAAKVAPSSGPTPREQLEAFIPMHRYGEPGEVAHGVVFLLSDWASYITGIGLLLDGGVLSMQGGQSW